MPVLLASSLQAYLHTRVKMHCEELTEEKRKRVFRKGWVGGYNIIFTQAFGIPFADGPVAIAVLEDIVQTRNSIQHDVEITNLKPKHLGRKPGSAPSVFLDARETELLERMDIDARSWLTPPTVHVDHGKLESSIDTMARFVVWLDDAIEARFHPKR